MSDQLSSLRFLQEFRLHQLPTDEETKKFGMKIIKLPNTTHNEMDDNANEEQRNEIRNYVLSFLQNI